MMRIVIGPQEITHQLMLDRQFKSDWIILERRSAVFAEVLARQLFQLRQRPHVMLSVSLIHCFKRPRYPANTAFYESKPNLRKTLQDARGAQRRHWFDRRGERVGDIVNYGATIFTGCAR